MSISCFFTATKANSRRICHITSSLTGSGKKSSKHSQHLIRKAQCFVSICAFVRKARLGRWRARSKAWRIIMQALQLIHGAHHPFLQEPSMLKALRALRQLDLLPRDEVLTLDKTYRFLRRVEHRLQIEAEQQIHTVPQEPEALQQLSRSLRFSSAEDFTAALRERMCAVRPIFRRIISEMPAEPAKIDLEMFSDQT